MATKKPRLTVTLEPEVYEVVRELSEVNGESMSRIISGVMGATTDTLRAVIEAGKRYAALEAGMQSEVRERFTRAEERVRPVVDDLASELVEMFGEAADPRPVTRGSRPPTQTPPDGGES